MMCKIESDQIFKYRIIRNSTNNKKTDAYTVLKHDQVGFYLFFSGVYLANKPIKNNRVF